MSTAWSIRLELWSWYEYETWGFAGEDLGCWVGDHIETSFQDWFATQVTFLVNSLSDDGPASIQAAAVMESGQHRPKWEKQRPAKSHEPRGVSFQIGNRQVIDTLGQLLIC